MVEVAMNMGSKRVCGVIFCILFAWGFSACQPKQPEMITVGVVNFVKALEPALDGFKAGMTGLGYIEGEDIVYLYEGEAATQELLEKIAMGFVEDQVDIILSISTPATLAAQRATTGTNIPVVFVPVTDPVSTGMVESLSNPGGNLTGVTNAGSESRRLEWLTKLAPGIETIYIPHNSNDASATSALQTAQEAALKLGVELVPQEATDDEQMENAVHAIPDNADAIFMLPDSLAIRFLPDLVANAIERRLPLSAPTSAQVQNGALISYGLDLFESGKQAGRLADQILRGTAPAVLPVEEAIFFLAINLDTARALELTIPEEIIRQADLIYPNE
jgi:putative tryptophan/tyrosine transport system substrate-binding protein